MRVAVLPRETAATVITGSVSRVGFAFGGLSLAADIPVLAESYASSGVPERLALPVALLLVQIAALVWAGWSGRVVPVAVYLVAGSAATLGFQVVVLHDVPGAGDMLFLLNRPAAALVLIGVEAGTAAFGVLWLSLGMLAASTVPLATEAIVGDVVGPGWAPFVLYVLGVFAYLGFDLVQRASRRRLPNFDELEAETQSLVEGASLSRRTTAVVHDTVLNDLAIVMNGPDLLEQDALRRLRHDLDTLTSADWLTVADRVGSVDAGDAELRNAIARVAGDLQWRGLTVRISGEGVLYAGPRIVEAVPDAIRAALENVLRHSGTTVAEIALLVEAGTLTVMVTDDGVGFDPAGVGDDRLGLRGSIVRRIEDIGGEVRIWSSPGAGTSVVFRIPLPAREAADA